MSAICVGLDHEVVFLSSRWRDRTLVGTVDQNFIVEFTGCKVILGQLNGHELGQVLLGRACVNGLHGVNHVNVCSCFLLHNSHDVDLVGHAAKTTPWDVQLSHGSGEVNVRVGRAQAGGTPAEEAITVQIIGGFTVCPQHVICVEWEVVSTAESVVANITATAVDAEVNHHVRGGQVSSGHTEVDTVAFNVGHKEIVCSVTAHVTWHGESSGVESVAANPIVVGSVNGHDFRLEACRHVGSTLVVRGGQEQCNFIGWSGTEMVRFHGQEVGFVDDSRGVHVDPCWVQSVTNRGDMRT